MMNSSKIKINRYASLSIYCSSKDDLESILASSGIRPDRLTEREGLFAFHLTTKGVVSSDDCRVHLKKLFDDYKDFPELLRSLGLVSPPSVTLWIYFDVKNGNEMINIPAEIVNWLSRLGGEIAFDLWSAKEARS